MTITNKPSSLTLADLEAVEKAAESCGVSFDLLGYRAIAANHAVEMSRALVEAVGVIEASESRGYASRHMHLCLM